MSFTFFESAKGPFIEPNVADVDKNLSARLIQSTAGHNFGKDADGVTNALNAGQSMEPAPKIPGE